MNFKNADIVAAVVCCGVVLAAGALDPGPLGNHWKINHADWAGKVQFQLSRIAPHSKEVNSFPVPLSELNGLKAEQLRGVQSPVHFQLQRDAGNFVCEGVMTLGSGSGQFTFAPNRSFGAEMEKLGYFGLSDDKLYRMALENTGLSYAMTMRDAGLTNLSLDELMSLH